MLEIQDISKSFYHKIALQNVSFKVNSGEIFGLLGPNGAGKTTLIRIINQIFQADSGIIRYKNELLKSSHLADIGYLPEERGLYKTMTVQDHAEFLGRLRGMSAQDIKNALNFWLDRFNIQDWRKKRIEELSKGMAQKVQFICTVLHEPKLLILDEPFSGFDPINAELIKHELIEMRAQGKTIILSSHDMKSVEEICDRVVLIDKAKKIMEGRVSDLRNDGRTGNYKIQFQGNMIAFVNALWINFELVDKQILSDDRFIATVAMRGENNFDSLLQSLIGVIKIESAHEDLPSMNDLFIKAVSERKEIADV